jgi:hypothetical protein
MAAFTDIADWTSAQDTAAANEIVLAYSERRQCVGDAAVDPLDAGDNAQDTAFWKGMQDWITSKCVNWVNDYDFSTSTEYDSPGEIAYTIATFKTQSELTGGLSGVIGFRRATTWPTDWTDYEDAAYSYGPIQAGDIRGPWIFEDLQKAFDALRWTFELSVDNPGIADVSFENSQTKSSTGTGTTAVEAYNDAVSNWPATWTANSGAYAYTALTISEELGTDSFSHSLSRDESDVTWESLPTHLPHSADAYYWMVTPRTFDDIDSLSMEDKKFNARQTYESDTTATRTLLNAGIDDAPGSSGYGDFWIDSGNELLLLKWEFTNTL